MEAAENIVLNRGANALTADALAKEANISRRSIFNHFPSVQEAVYARMSQYLIELRGEFTPEPSEATSGFEAVLLHHARKVFTLKNIEKYMQPTVSIGLKMVESGIDSDSWGPAMTADLSRQAFAQTRDAFPHARPVHLLVIVNLLIDVIEGGVELWVEEYTAAQESEKTPPTMERLHSLIHEGFDYIQHFVDNAPEITC